MDLIRFGKNLLMAMVLLAVVVVLHESKLPATRRLEEYIAFVVTTDLEYRPLVEMSRSFNPLGEGVDVGGWWQRWRESFPAAPASTSPGSPASSRSPAMGPDASPFGATGPTAGSPGSSSRLWPVVAPFPDGE